MRPKVVVTVDVERDYPNALDDCYLGIAEGLPRILNLMSDFEIQGDFFMSREVVKRFRHIAGSLEAAGHFVGNHGAQHGYLCGMDLQSQLKDLCESTETLSEASSRPVMFRAPQFGADGNTILALEELGYRIDSSVLPGRVVKSGIFGKTLDFASAPREVYHPSRSDIAKVGSSPIVEIPLTENPSKNGTPIGMGYLNSEGHGAIMDAYRTHGGSYFTFLIHPWECVDLHGSYPSLPKYLGRECSSDLTGLERLFRNIKDIGDFTNLMSITDEYVGGGPR